MNRRAIYIRATVHTDSPLEVEQILGEPLDEWNKKMGTHTSISIHEKLPETAMAPKTIACPNCGEEMYTEDPPYYYCNKCKNNWEIYEGE